jgi:murein DD-endopeptidase MepM/ murein hydrolase activator NlpD
MRFRDHEQTVTWSSASRRPRGSRPNRRLILLLLALPMLLGSIGAAPNAPTVQGDELSDARARQAQLKKQIANQRAQVARLTSMQSSLSADIKATTREIRSINADLTVVRTRIGKMETRIDAVKAAYQALVQQGQMLAVSLARVEAEEAQKAAALVERKNLLAERIRSAYDTDRTSLLESFLSGGSFTDLLAEASYLIDVGEQDEALAREIEHDQEVLASVHQTVQDTRAATEVLRKETAAQKKELDKSLKALKVAQKELKKLEKATKRALAKQKAAYEQLARNKKDIKRAIAKGESSQRALAKRIKSIIAKQARAGNIPSEFNGTFRWPMVGRISGEFGCSSYPGYGPGNGCAHFHNGIDIVAPYGTKVKAAAAGTVVYIGWNYADGSDPAWIVIIAHSTKLQTWYAHMQGNRRPVRVGQRVKAGQVIGYEGNTGNSTGAHLHWMVELNGSWKNPRLFL